MKPEFSSFEVGQKLCVFSVDGITRDQLKAFANASGDPNPIHLHEDAAQAAGLPGVIVHGMLVASLLSEAAQVYFGERPDLFRVRFKEICVPDIAIEIHGSVLEAGPQKLVLSLEASTSTGQVLTHATAEWNRL